MISIAKPDHRRISRSPPAPRRNVRPIPLFHPRQTRVMVAAHRPGSVLIEVWRHRAKAHTRGGRLRASVQDPGLRLPGKALTRAACRRELVLIEAWRLQVKVLTRGGSHRVSVNGPGLPLSVKVLTKAARRRGSVISPGRRPHGSRISISSAPARMTGTRGDPLPARYGPDRVSNSGPGDGPRAGVST